LRNELLIKAATNQEQGNDNIDLEEVDWKNWISL
jgi:hypothetical protein